MNEIKISSLKDALTQKQLGILQLHKDKFKEHKCVENARLVTNLLGFICVEGVILVVIDDTLEMRYCRHCWNFVPEKNMYIDVTSEYCFTRKADEIKYFAIALCDEIDYQKLKQTNPSRVFCSKAVAAVTELNFDMDFDELKRLEKAIIDKGKEYGNLENDLKNEDDFCEQDKLILKLKDKNQECKELFERYKQRLKNTINDLMKDLCVAEKKTLDILKDDILSDTSMDISKSRLQKLEELKEVVLNYLAI